MAVFIDPSQLFEIMRSAYEITEEYFERAALEIAALNRAMEEALEEGYYSWEDVANRQKYFVEDTRIKENQESSGNMFLRDVASAIIRISRGEELQDFDKKTLNHLSQIALSAINGVSIWVSIAASAGILARTASELTNTLSTPNQVTVTILALTPPPLVIALYAIVAATNMIRFAQNSFMLGSAQYQLIRDSLRSTDSPYALNKNEKSELMRQRNKAGLDLIQASLGLALAATVITSTLLAPGSMNLVGLSILAASMTITLARVGVGVVKGLWEMTPFQSTQKNQSQEPSNSPDVALSNKKEVGFQPEHYSKNFFKNLLPAILLISKIQANSIRYPERVHRKRQPVNQNPPPISANPHADGERVNRREEGPQAITQVAQAEQQPLQAADLKGTFDFSAEKTQQSVQVDALDLASSSPEKQTDSNQHMGLKAIDLAREKPPDPLVAPQEKCANITSQYSEHLGPTVTQMHNKKDEESNKTPALTRGSGSPSSE